MASSWSASIALLSVARVSAGIVGAAVRAVAALARTQAKLAARKRRDLRSMIDAPSEGSRALSMPDEQWPIRVRGSGLANPLARRSPSCCRTGGGISSACRARSVTANGQERITGQPGSA